MGDYRISTMSVASSSSRALCAAFNAGRASARDCSASLLSAASTLFCSSSSLALFSTWIIFSLTETKHFTCHNWFLTTITSSMIHAYWPMFWFLSISSNKAVQAAVFLSRTSFWSASLTFSSAICSLASLSLSRLASRCLHCTGTQSIRSHWSRNVT